MRVIITEWALQAYLDLLSQNVFSHSDYRKILRPDVKLLKAGLPSPHTEFQTSKFWGPAKSPLGMVSNGFKMKWHNLGPGNVQLRLAVAIIAGDAYLCQAYVKKSEAQDLREGANLKHYINLIHAGRYTWRGDL